MQIREAQEEDFDAIWSIFSEVVQAGDTYAYPVETSKDEAFAIWMKAPRKTFLAEEDGVVLGTYYLKTNQVGQGDHVCNCGYMVPARARRRGIARAMCTHSQGEAKTLGYRAMQFNFVASTNAGAVTLWNDLGFETVGRLPGAFCHPQHGDVDALVMYKRF